MSAYVDVVFDGPPSPPRPGRFVEAEDSTGRGVKAGEWIDRGDGNWALRIPSGVDGEAHEALRDALSVLVALKRGPRDENYQSAKDEAWARAERVLAMTPRPDRRQADVGAMRRVLIVAAKLLRGRFPNGPVTEFSKGWLEAADTLEDHRMLLFERALETLPRVDSVPIEPGVLCEMVAAATLPEDEL